MRDLTSELLGLKIFSLVLLELTFLIIVRRNGDWVHVFLVKGFAQCIRIL